MKKYKTMKIIFWVVLLVGSAALGVWLAVSHMPLNTPVLWIWLGLMALGAIIVTQAKAVSVNKKLEEIAPLLESDPDAYISKLEALLGNEKGNLEQVYYLNLGAAYCSKKDYAAAKQWLLRVEPKKLGVRTVRDIYWADLALVYFCLREDEAGCAVMEAHRKELGDGRAQSIEGLVAMLKVYEQLAKGDRAAARRLMKSYRPLWKGAEPGALADLKKRLGR